MPRLITEMDSAQGCRLQSPPRLLSLIASRLKSEPAAVAKASSRDQSESVAPIRSLLSPVLPDGGRASLSRTSSDESGSRVQDVCSEGCL